MEKEDILIRKAKPSDVRGIAKSFNENLRKGFSEYTGSNEYMNKKKINEMKKRLSEGKKHFCIYVAIDKKTGKIIGSCMLNGKEKGRQRHKVELGWGVNHRYMRKGISTRICKEMIREAKKRGFKRIEAEVAVENIASVKLAKKLGLKIEGRMKAGLILDNGKYIDTYIFGKVIK